MSDNHYDYIIVGSGLAGLQLALAFSNDSFFSEKQIALIDPSQKSENDKTWSFWEKKPSQWNDIIYQSWENANIYTNKKHIELQLEPYEYKSIRSIDLYTKITALLKTLSNFHFIIDSVTSISEEEKTIVKTKTNIYSANHVFDSRLPKDFLIKKDDYITLNQHFKGLVIETKTNTFKNEVTMMDYRLKDGEQTTFMYVLPFSKNKALIEFTYFTEHVVNEKTYESFIEDYLRKYLDIKDYKIIEKEIGQIPMTTFPFEKYHTSYITKIGTAGGWVKASTGYSFKHTEKKVKKIIQNMKAKKVPSHNLLKKKYKFYDKVFLKVLQDENHKGEWIFEKFYSKNSVQTMFRFLDEESTFIEELKIMTSLFSWSFIKAFFKTL